MLGLTEPERGFVFGDVLGDGVFFFAGGGGGGYFSDSLLRTSKFLSEAKGKATYDPMVLALSS